MLSLLAVALIVAADPADQPPSEQLRLAANRAAQMYNDGDQFGSCLAFQVAVKDVRPRTSGTIRALVNRTIEDANRIDAAGSRALFLSERCRQIVAALQAEERRTPGDSSPVRPKAGSLPDDVRPKAAPAPTDRPPVLKQSLVQRSE